MYCNSLGCIAENKAVGLYCKMGVVGLELYSNTVIVLQTERLGWQAVSNHSRSVLWLGKGLLGGSRYKICIMTEAASVARRWAGRAGRATGVRARRGGAEAGPRARWAHAGHGRRVVGARGKRGTGERGALGARGRQARGAPGLGARAGQGCALCALGLFSALFDSVLFLSRFLDIAREPGS